jgi:hypothetical protein
MSLTNKIGPHDADVSPFEGSNEIKSFRHLNVNYTCVAKESTPVGKASIPG